MLIITIILSIIIILLLLEKWLTQRSVNSLKLRIHVNGTRGKSSVTEYIAAGISGSQSDVMAKVTGIIPTIIHNGKRTTIRRTGMARVQEQVNTINLAARKKVKSLILECMSVSPDLQKLESKLFRPNFYIITNIRDDHREEMGGTIEEQVNHICKSIPPDCIVITNEQRFLKEIKNAASQMRSRVIIPGELDQELSAKLPPGIFPGNVALALTVCDAAGLDHRSAEKGIMENVLNVESPLLTINHEGKQIKFLNAFSVNDVESTESFVNYWRNQTGYQGKISVILGTRADRPIRTDLIAKWIGDSSASIEHIIITGNHTGRANHDLSKAGVDKKKTTVWKGKNLKNIKETVFNTIPDGSLLVGIGNIGGAGFHILNELK